MECLYLNNLIDLLKIIVTSLITLLAVYFGYKNGLKHLKAKMRLDFAERQLREFYSPLIGYRKKIQSISELRFDVFKATDKQWKEFCETNPRPSEDDFKPYQNSIIYDNKQFRDELMPLYDKMVSLFTENYFLAESDTKKYYNELIMFVEIWHRWLSEAIPKEVITRLNHTEERLIPFYNDLENQLNKLSKEISNK